MRDKEEELDTSLQKIDTLRQDIRKAEKLRRELELRAEEALNEAAKEKKAREKAEAAALTTSTTEQRSVSGCLLSYLQSNQEEILYQSRAIRRLILQPAKRGCVWRPGQLEGRDITSQI